ncbi:uncharacterized protein LOC116200116 [Punica granatum]|uniref:Uncharacterized protein LOC116200116 n=1 Tax=Punica granatum TaxID=22663 RepID=A0A6P8CXF5_PUNGR|nr:uncharacterized protein LOC116200116 [Punica granatum]
MRTLNPLYHKISLTPRIGAFENLQCLIFLGTLTGIASDWLHLLAPCSITSFKQLQELFIQRFAATRRVKRDLNELFTMEQKEGETLRAWYKDLFKVFTKIESLSPRKAMSAFQRGLRKRRLKKSLIVRKTLLIL